MSVYGSANLIRTNDDIRVAVKLWCINPKEAQRKYGHINDWDTSQVTNMRGLFTSQMKFNEAIGNWDVSNVINMEDIFFRATKFNQPLNKWNVSKVKNMRYMFMGAEAFNQPLNSWDVSKVTKWKVCSLELIPLTNRLETGTFQMSQI